MIERTGVTVETVIEGERKRAHQATRSDEMPDGAKEFVNWLGARVLLNRLNWNSETMRL